MHLFNKELICLIFLGVQAATLFFTSLPLSHQTQYQHHYCRPIILFSSFYPISLSSLRFKAPGFSVICLSDLLPPYPILLCHLHHHQHISCRFWAPGQSNLFCMWINPLSWTIAKPYMEVAGKGRPKQLPSKPKAKLDLQNPSVQRAVQVS